MLNIAHFNYIIQLQFSFLGGQVSCQLCAKVNIFGNYDCENI